MQPLNQIQSYLGNPNVKRDGVQEQWTPEKLQEYNKKINVKIKQIDSDSKRLLGLIDIFDEIKDTDFTKKFRECILDGTNRIFMNTSLRDDIIEYKKCIQKHMLFLRLGHKISGGKVNPLCPLCLTNEVNMCYVSCGHATCRTCFNCTDKKTCSICRSNINDVVNLYLV